MSYHNGIEEGNGKYSREEEILTFRSHGIFCGDPSGPAFIKLVLKILLRYVIIK